MKVVVVNTAPTEGWVNCRIVVITRIGSILRQPRPVIVFNVVILRVEDIENVANDIVPVVSFPSASRVVRNRGRRNSVSALIEYGLSAVMPADVTTFIDSGTSPDAARSQKLPCPAIFIEKS